MKNKLDKRIGTVVEFEKDGHLYSVVGQRTKQYHLDASLLFYGFIDGDWAKKSETSSEPKECLESLVKNYNLNYKE